MAGRSAWTPGNGVGLTWSSAFNSADLASMTAAYSVLSSVADIDNGTALDQFMDVSVRLAISSSTIASGAAISLFRYDLLDDATTYGDGQLTAGTQANVSPAMYPLPSIDLPPASAVTKLVGMVTGILIPPGKFRLALQNNSGFNLSSGTQVVKYRTYNVNNNN